MTKYIIVDLLQQFIYDQNILLNRW